MTSKLIVNNIEADAGVSTITFGSEISASTFTGNVTGNLTGNVTSSSTSTFTSGLNVTGGSVGIKTDNPSTSLQVRGTADAPTLTWNGSGQTIIGDLTNQLSIGRLNSSPFALYLQARGSNDAARDILLNPVGGDVGIGTDNPGARLEVNSGTSSQVIIKTPGANNTARATRLSFAFDDGEGAAIQSSRITGGSTLNCSLSFRTGGVTNSEERLGIGTDGNVSITNGNLVFSTSGTGIDFSATGDGSGTDSSELLDDYEEGTFTAEINFDNLSLSSHTTSSGFYVKVGRHVRCDIWIRFNGSNLSGTPAANAGVWISGLPYAGAVASGNTQWVGTPVAVGRLPEYRGRNDSTDFNRIYFYMGNNSSLIYLGVNKDPQSPISTDFLYGMSEKSFSSLIGQGYIFELRTSLSYMASS